VKTQVHHSHCSLAQPEVLLLNAVTLSADDYVTMSWLLPFPSLPKYVLPSQQHQQQQQQLDAD